jgi:parvulin-like peptidyl-prolyl isomerase
MNKKTQKIIKMTKPLSFATWAITVMAWPLANAESSANATNPEASAISGDAVVARGQGFEIRRSDIDQVLGSVKANNPQDNLPPDAEIHAIGQLIEIQLVLQKATDAEKAEGKKEGELNFANIVKSLSAPELADRLKVAGMTAEDLRLKLVQDATAQLSLTRQLGINVTDGEVKSFYDGHPGAFDQPAKAHVRELVLLTTAGTSGAPLSAATIQAKHQQMLDLDKRIQAGEDFAALAKQYNEDPISKNTGGEFSFKREQMEFGDLAFSMKTNQISDVLTNSDGYRIFQLLEIIPAKKAEFAAIAGQIKNALIGAEKRRLAPAYINQLRKEADVEILDAGLKAKLAVAEAANPPAAPPAKPQ